MAEAKAEQEGVAETQKDRKALTEFSEVRLEVSAAP